MPHRYRAITLIWSPLVYLGFGAKIARRVQASQDREQPEQQRAKTFVASDYYCDCTKSMMEVVIMFLSQFSLLCFYLPGLYTDGTPNFSNGKVFAFYYAGASSPPCDASSTHTLYACAFMCM